MDKKMKAARVHQGESRFRVEEVDVPTIGDDDVLIQVKATALTYSNMAIWYFTPYLKIFPTTLGNEFAGVIVQMGRRVRNLSEGQRVAVHTGITCGSCRYCRSSQEPSCKSQMIIGFGCPGEHGLANYETYHQGGLAEYVRVPASAVDPISDRVSFDAASRLSALAIPLRGIAQSGVGIGDTLVVNVATGATGAGALKVARLFGLAKVIAIGRSASGLARVSKLAPEGLVETICTEELPSGWEQGLQLKQAILDKTNGQGADGLLDLSPMGVDSTMQSIAALRNNGSAVLVGGNYGPMPLIYGEIMQHAYEIKGYRGVVRKDEDALLRLMEAGQLDIQDMITHRFPLERINDAVDAVLQRAEKPILLQIDT